MFEMRCRKTAQTSQAGVCVCVCFVVLSELRYADRVHVRGDIKQVRFVHF